MFNNRKEIKETAKNLVDLNIDSIFTLLHEKAGTKTGDISPEQAIELDRLKESLVDLMAQQVWQNGPQLTNKNRADRARKALAIYKDVSDNTFDSVVDLLADLFHFCQEEHIDMEDQFETAKEHFSEEFAEEHTSKKLPTEMEYWNKVTVDDAVAHRYIDENVIDADCIYVWVIVTNNMPFWIQQLKDGSYYTIYENTSESGTFFDCVTCINTYL